MKSLLLAASLCCALPAAAQIISIDLRHGPPYTRVFHTQAADNNPAAETPEQIFQVNKTLAESGNKEAAYQLGLAYMQGMGVAADLTQAAHWFSLGAVKPEQAAYIAEFYGNGEYFTKNVDEAAHWYIKAGRPGDLFALGRLYQSSSPSRNSDAAALYRRLLTMTGAPEVRRAQMELGNLVLDGQYTAGDDAAGHALNLEWARIIAQELLGQQEYNIAVAYDANVDGMPQDKAMWLRFVRRAAAYNVDLAQNFYGQALLHGDIPDASPFEGYAWVRLASDKQFGLRRDVGTMESTMAPEQKQQANSLFDGLVQTRLRDGAYYPVGDPLREPSAKALIAMPADDPDVELRQAFALEQTHDSANYAHAMDLYRRVRDRRGIDIKLLLARQYREGSNDVPKNEKLARYWQTSAERGPEAARPILK